MLTKALPWGASALAIALVSAPALAQGAAPPVPTSNVAAAEPAAPSMNHEGEAAPEQSPAAAGGASTAPAPYYQQVPADRPPPPGQPMIYVQQPPLPPLEPRNRYYHDGFYLRLSSGFGGLWATSSVDHHSASAKVSGPATTFDVMVGGTPAPGLVVGAALLLQSAFDPNVELRGQQNVPGLASRTSSNGQLVSALLGPMIDAFPNAAGGFHFGGLLGLSAANLASKDDTGSGGLGVSTWAGYMWWASSQWSLGGLIRLSAAWTGRKRLLDDLQTEANVTDTSTSATLMFSAAYH